MNIDQKINLIESWIRLFRRDDFFEERLSSGFFDEILDDQLITCMVESQPDILSRINTHLIKDEHILLALRKDVRTISGFYSLIASDSLIKSALKLGVSLHWISPNLMTSEILMEAVKIDGFNLAYAQEALVTEDIALAAVQSCGQSVSYVPEGRLTKQIVFEAIKCDAKSYFRLPESWRSVRWARMVILMDFTLILAMPYAKAHRLVRLAAETNLDLLNRSLTAKGLRQYPSDVSEAVMCLSNQNELIKLLGRAFISKFGLSEIAAQINTKTRLIGIWDLFTHGDLSTYFGSKIYFSECEPGFKTEWKSPRDELNDW